MSTKPTQTHLSWHEILETISWYQNQVYSSQNQQQINRDNKLISKSSVSSQNQQQITETKLISKQYPSHKEISGTSTKPTLTLHCTFEFETTRMGESLIDLVHQYPALWDKQNSKYKDRNYKDAKWREIAETLGGPKDDAIKKWKSLWDTYVRHKNIKAKSGDGLSESKPRWKYYAIMSFLDVTLLRRRYAANLFEFTYIHSCILFP